MYAESDKVVMPNWYLPITYGVGLAFLTMILFMVQKQFHK